MAEHETVTVSLPTARVYRGRAYGPGRDIEIPARVARALGLDGKGAPAAAPSGKGKPK